MTFAEMRKPSPQNAEIFTVKVVFLFMFMKKITLGKSYTLYNSAPYTEVTQVSLLQQPPNTKLLRLQFQHTSLHYFPLVSSHMNVDSDNHVMTYCSNKHNWLVTIGQWGWSSIQQQLVQSGKPRQMSSSVHRSSSHVLRTGKRNLLFRIGIPRYVTYFHIIYPPCDFI